MPELISEPDISNLTTPVESIHAHAEDRARRLGGIVCRNIELATTNEYMWISDGDPGAFDVIHGPEHKVSQRVVASLIFAVGKEFEGLQGTPRWISNTSQVELRLETYDTDLPDDLGSLTVDEIADQSIFLKPATEPVRPDTPQQEQTYPYTATYQDNTSLESAATETVINILTLIADNAEGQSVG
jgi:hypothetical protein